MGHLDHQKPRSRPFHYTDDFVCTFAIFSNLFGIDLAGSVKGNGMCFIYRSIQAVGRLKALYALPPGRPFHSGTNSAAL